MTTESTVRMHPDFSHLLVRPGEMTLAAGLEDGNVWILKLGYGK